MNQEYRSVLQAFLSFFSASPEMVEAKKLIKKLKINNNVIQSKRYILVESFQTPSNRLGLVFFAPILSNFLNAKLVSYYMMNKTPFKLLKEKFRFFFSMEKALGCQNFMFIGSRKSKKHYEEARNLLRDISDLRELENLCFKNIIIGDLIYDVYLRKFRRPTLDLNDQALVGVISEFIQYFETLYDKFSNNEIAGVCVSHTVYLLGLPSRLASYFDIPAFQVTGESIYRIDRKNTHAYTAFKVYPEIFESLPVSVQNRGRELAKKRLEKRFEGQVGVDMHYSTKSAFQNPEANSRILKDNSRPHILVAIHDFYDSPHSYGLNLYPDFYQWLLALAKISQRTKYNWYIKTHPDVRGDGLSVIEAFVDSNQGFTLIPASTSHHQLINEGINLALTIFGSIAMEYPYLGKAVVNASLNNPHVRYSFSISPSTVSEYENLLMDITQLEAPEDTTSILEYYFMNNIYMLKSWTIKDYDAYFTEIGGPSRAFGWQIFRYYSKGDNVYKPEELRDVINKFLSSGDLFLSRKHFSNQFSSDEIPGFDKLSLSDKWDI